MATENTVFMVGRIMEKPLIKINAKQEFVVARIKLLTVRRTKANEELKLLGTPRIDNQYIITRNPKIIEHRIVPLKEGDMVLVKGTLSTRETKKKYTCPHCGTLNVYEGSIMIYVDPIFIEKIQEDTMTEQEATDKLLSKAEVSNYAFISGTVCRTPEYYKSPDGKKEECDFQLAIKRKRRIIEDGPEKMDDYPFVKTYGKKTLEYSQVLHTGSEIFINGAIQAREIVMLKECGECNMEFEAPGATMEIVPYSVEYLKNCDIPQREDDEESENISDEDKALTNEAFELDEIISNISESEESFNLDKITEDYLEENGIVDDFNNNDNINNIMSGVLGNSFLNNLNNFTDFNTQNEEHSEGDEDFEDEDEEYMGDEDFGEYYGDPEEEYEEEYEDDESEE